jgi:hypothetical protein
MLHLVAENFCTSSKTTHRFIQLVQPHLEGAVVVEAPHAHAAADVAAGHPLAVGRQPRARRRVLVLLVEPHAQRIRRRQKAAKLSTLSSFVPHTSFAASE